MLIGILKISKKGWSTKGITTASMGDVLDELQKYVQAIDYANALNSMDGLIPLMNQLKNSHATIRAKAADVMNTIVQNNPVSQGHVTEEGGVDLLIQMCTNEEEDDVVKFKALAALSSLIRYNRKGIQAFLGQGYNALKMTLRSNNVRSQRYALNMLQWLLKEDIEHCSTAVGVLSLPDPLVTFASNNNADIREAALRCFLELTRYKEEGGTSIFGSDQKMKKVLEDRISSIILLSEEDLKAVREEIKLVDSLWNLYYNEASEIARRGLVILPDQDACPPDIASNYFEPPLRAWPPNHYSNDSSLYLGLAPPLSPPPPPKDEPNI